jgi:hypothetical protein
MSKRELGAMYKPHAVEAARRSRVEAARRKAGGAIALPNHQSYCFTRPSSHRSKQRALIDGFKKDLGRKGVSSLLRYVRSAACVF